jgi:hypothetical protein
VCDKESLSLHPGIAVRKILAREMVGRKLSKLAESTSKVDSPPPIPPENQLEGGSEPAPTPLGIR